MAEKAEISLKRVVGGILQALREAKFLGDKESARLMEIYKSNSILSAFTVPAFSISEVEVELRFAVASLPEERRKRKAEEATDIMVKITPEALKGLEPHHISTMRVKFSPVEMKVFEEAGWEK
jgi:hypothetical protein